MRRTLRRAAAALLALLLSAAPALSALAEDSRRPTDADLQQTVVSREGEEKKTLAEILLSLAETMQREEFQNLLRIDDVAVITNEVTVKILIWLYENRPVTMKILAELGAGEDDIRCVEKIWDSGERIGAAVKEYMDSEEGKELTAAEDALAADESFTQAFLRVLEDISSDDLRDLMEVSAHVLEAQDPAAVNPGDPGSLTRAALDRAISDQSFLGGLLMKLLDLLDRHAGAIAPLKTMLTNERLWAVLFRLANYGGAMDDTVRDEFERLRSDPDIEAFIQRTLAALSREAEKASAQLHSKPGETAEPEQTETKEAVP